MPTTRLRDALLRGGVQPSIVDAIVRSARPTIALRATRESAEGTIRVGATKIAGGADLPLGTTWPSAEGVPFRFLAQIDLAEVAALLPDNPLPTSGLLSFFWCQEHEIGMTPDGCRVLHTPASTPLVRMPDPWAVRPARVGLLQRLFNALMRREPPTGGQGFPACRADLAFKLTLPAPDSPRAVPRERFSDADYDRVYLGGLENELAAAGLVTSGHRLLGEASPIQGAIEFDAEVDATGCSYQDAARGAAAWRLLFQVDTDSAPDFCFGDAGSIYFVMRDTDLKHHRWDCVRAVFQCF